MRPGGPAGRSAGAAAASRGFPAHRLYPALVFLLTVALYLPSVRNGFVYDDDTLILRERRPASLRAFTEIFDQGHFPGLPYYRPVTRLTFRIQKYLHGDDAGPYHLFNALLMGVAGVAAYGLLRRPMWRAGAFASGAAGPGASGDALPPALACLAAVLFTTHPTASSCVYPICSGRETLLPSLFILLAVYAWLGRGWRWRAAAVAAWVLALFGKEQAIVVPVLFAAADALDLNGERRLKSLAPTAAWYGLMGLLAIGYLSMRVRLFSGSEFESDLAQRPWLPALSYLYALQTVIAPFARLVYEPLPEVWFVPWRSAAGLIAGAALGLAAWRLRRRLGPAPLFWAAWFVMVQLPTANVVRQEAKFDERYVFLAGLAAPALALAAAAAATGLRDRRRAGAVWAAAIVAAGLSLVSLGRRHAFADDLAFSRQWAATSPGSAIALNNVANGLAQRGRHAEAEGYLRRAVSVGPPMAEVAYNLGLTLYKLGRVEESATWYREALRLDPGYKADYNYGVTLEALGDAEAAERHYRIALLKAPDHADAHHNLGLLLAKSGLTDEAVAEFHAAARLAPGLADSWYNMGVTLEQAGRLEGAEQAYREAIRREPGRAAAHFNLGNLLFRRSAFADAAASYAEALRLDPSDARARQNMEAARARASAASPAPASAVP